MKKRKTNFIEMEDVINQFWISKDGLMTLLPQLNDNRARIEFNEIIETLKSRNEPYFETKPRLVPITIVLDRYKLDKNLIRREANKMREEMR